MKKTIALIVAAVMLCAAMAALAEEGQIAPLYATVGDALEDSDEDRAIAGGEADYYAVVTQKDGKYYRSVAYSDETMNELQEAINNLDFEEEDFFEKLEAAMNAADEYRMTLPIAYSEEFTALPLTDGEMESMLGKTLAQLTEEGFEIGNNGTEYDDEDEMVIVYSLRYGVYDYNCVVEADFDQYIAAQENDTEGDLVVKGVSLAGITQWGYEKRFHTDGTVDEPEDLFAGFSEMMTNFLTLAEKAQAGEEIDIEAFSDTLKAEYPDFAEMIDAYVSMFQSFGPEEFAAMLPVSE